VTADSVPGQGSEFRVRIPDALVGGDEDTLRPGARLMH